MRSKRTDGFTLIELLIVIVIIGILAAVAAPKFSATKGKAQITAMKSDLRNLASSQEDYFYANSKYTPTITDLNVQTSTGVNLTITEATTVGWSAQTTHPQAPGVTCAVFFGTAGAVAPATVEGKIVCQ